MRRTFVVICVALLATSAVAVTMLATAVLAGAQPAQTQLRANQRAARRDAERLVRLLRLPSGVAPTSSAPSWASALVGTFAPGRYSASDNAYWSTDAKPRATIAYVLAHPPAGSSAAQGTGSGSDSKTGVTSLDVQFNWPDLGQQVSSRMLTVTVVTPPHGRSVVIAHSQSVWVVPRPASEHVPAGVHAVVVTLRIGTGVEGLQHEHTSSQTFTDPAAVSAIVDALDSLTIVQPGMVMMCPLIFAGNDPPTLSLAFKSSATGATLALARVLVRPGAGGYSGASSCDSIQFFIAGKQQTPLVSTTFVKQIGKLIGANIS